MHHCSQNAEAFAAPEVLLLLTGLLLTKNSIPVLWSAPTKRVDYILALLKSVAVILENM